MKKEKAFLEGHFAERFEAGERPQYGYPDSPLPTVQPGITMEIKTGFLKDTKKDSGPSHVMLRPECAADRDSLLVGHIYKVAHFDAKSKRCQIEVDSENAVWPYLEDLIPVKLVIKMDETAY